MKKAYLIFNRFLDVKGKQFVAGGVQTYLLNLSRIFISLKIPVFIYQCSDTQFVELFEGITVVGVPTYRSSSSYAKKILYKEVLKKIDQRNDFLIFGSDVWSVPCKIQRSISIQHGVFWDLPSSERGLLPYRGLFGLEKFLLKSKVYLKIHKYYLSRKSYRNFNNVKNRVCVDHNFINCYRTWANVSPFEKIYIVPNFSRLPSCIDKKNFISNKVRIIFARRFTTYRGVILWANVVNQLLKEFRHVEFTFAGEGPEEKYLKEYFKNTSRVKIIKYSPDDSLKIHLEHDISVVPSLGSEGTSLSLAEAMACGLAVIATNVGGMTNMIIDNFNGLLVQPCFDQLIRAARLLINDCELRRKLAINAMEICKSSFSFEKWENSWKEIIEQVDSF